MTIKLTGEVAEKYGFNNKNLELEEIISKFTENHKKIIQEDYKKQQQEFVSYLLQNISIERKSEAEKIRTALSVLMNNYLAFDLEKKYDKIKQEFFDLERKIINPINKDEFIKIPLFVRAKFEEESWKMSNSEFRKLNPDHNSYKEVSFESKIPIIPIKSIKKANIFYQDYLNSFSNSLKDPLIGEYIFNRIECGNYFSHLNFKAYWIPRLSDIKIEIKEKINEVDLDPLLIAHCFGKNFLVDNWLTKEEEPYEYYLREFKETKGQISGLN